MQFLHIELIWAQGSQDEIFTSPIVCRSLPLV